MDESQRTLQRLECLRQLNTDKERVNTKLYRLLYKEELYLVAYERIKSAPGNLTPGSDGETIDGFSLKAIRQIIQEMRTERFQFKPVRTVYLPKPNGKMRKLGIPMVRSYCPPSGKLSGWPCHCGSDQPTHSDSTIAYLACVDESLVASNGAEPAYGAQR